MLRLFQFIFRSRAIAIPTLAMGKSQSTNIFRLNDFELLSFAFKTFRFLPLYWIQFLKYNTTDMTPNSDHALDDESVSTFIFLKNSEKNIPRSNKSPHCKIVIYQLAILLAYLFFLCL